MIKVYKDSPANYTFIKNSTKQLLTPFYNRYAGVINELALRDELKRYGLYWAQTLSVDIAKLNNLNSDFTSGGLGIDEDIDIAVIKSFAEAIERFSLGCHDSLPITKRSFKEISSKEYCYKYTDYKSNYVTKTDSTLDTVKLTGINTTKGIQWPAGQIYISYNKSMAFMQTTSTGVAAHTETDLIKVSGLLEVIERDAVMLNHYLPTKLTMINPTTLPIDTKLQKELNKSFQIKVFQLTYDIDVPIYLCLLINESKKTYGIGASAGLNSKKAITKALHEAIFTENYSKHLIHLKVNNPLKIKALYEHFLFYQEENLKNLITQYSADEVVNYTPKSTTISRILNSMKEQQRNVYCVDVTPKAIKTTNFRIQRIIVPKSIDIIKKEADFPLGHARIKDFCLNTNTPYNLQNMPHPFP